jgi:predicted RNA-binding protein
MPRYWILCMSEDNYTIAREHGLIGLPEHAARAVQEMAIGDMIVFYITRKTVYSPCHERSHQIRRFRGIAE